MLTRRRFFTMAAIAALGATQVGRAVNAMASDQTVATGAQEPLTAFQSLDPKIDFNNEAEYFTDTSPLLPGGAWRSIHDIVDMTNIACPLHGDAYKRRTDPSAPHERIASFFFETEEPFDGKEPPRPKENGNMSLRLYGHGLDRFGRGTKFHHEGAKLSLQIQRQNGQLLVQKISPEGEIAEIAPGTPEHKSAMKIADVLFRKGARDMMANRISIILPPEKPKESSPIRSVLRHIFGG